MDNVGTTRSYVKALSDTSYTRDRITSAPNPCSWSTNLGGGDTLPSSAALMGGDTFLSSTTPVGSNSFLLSAKI